jgi:protein-tyrosine phosphatase
MAHLVAQSDLADRVVIDSAGTGGWHVGQKADTRARAEARRRGVVMESIARQFTRADFARFDLVIAMDGDNLLDLQRLAPDDSARAKVQLLRSFDPESRDDLNVPDPYFGGDDGFAEVFEMVDAACRGLVDHIRARPPVG